MKGAVSMALTKADIIEVIYAELGLPKNRCAEIVEAMLELMKSALEKGEDVLISGFGKFCVRDKKERRGRNPATGDDLLLDKRRVVTFKCSHLLRDKVNSSHPA